jgi:hypothetical protein
VRIELAAVTKGSNGTVLPSTSVTFGSGVPTLAQAETELRPTVLGLIASGRMRPDSGTVTIDGDVDYSAIRKSVALIDAPEVCEPANDVTVAGVTAEELMFAGRRSHPIAVMRELRALELQQYARQSIGTMPPTARIRLLCELALMREGVAGLVITSPDRHGGDPNQWWELARRFASRDLAVLVIAGVASATAIAAASLVERIQSTDAAVPVAEAEPGPVAEPEPVAEAEPVAELVEATQPEATPVAEAESVAGAVEATQPEGDPGVASLPTGTADRFFESFGTGGVGPSSATEADEPQDVASTRSATESDEPATNDEGNA